MSSGEFTEDMMDQIKNMFRDPQAMHRVMSEGIKFNNKGNWAMEAGKYDKALKYFKKAMEINAGVFDADSSHNVSILIGLIDAYIHLKDWDNAEKEAKRLLKIAENYGYDEDADTAREFLAEIDDGKNGREHKPNPEASNKKKEEAEEKIDPNCASCKKTDAKFRCSACKKTNYCSSECQRSDWPEHKSICSKLAASASGETEKPACGLCGFTGSRRIQIDKTECCDRWICQDVETYELMSYKLNSCQRNHERYTSCGSHFKEGHKGKYAECPSCQATTIMRLNGCCAEERAWEKFCQKHFYFENVGEKERLRNQALKRDGTKAMLTQIKLR